MNLNNIYTHIKYINSVLETKYCTTECIKAFVRYANSNNNFDDTKYEVYLTKKYIKTKCDSIPFNPYQSSFCRAYRVPHNGNCFIILYIGSIDSYFDYAVDIYDYNENIWVRLTFIKLFSKNNPFLTCLDSILDLTE